MKTKKVNRKKLKLQYIRQRNKLQASKGKGYFKFSKSLLNDGSKEFASILEDVAECKNLKRQYKLKGTLTIVNPTIGFEEDNFIKEILTCVFKLKYNYPTKL